MAALQPVRGTRDLFADDCRRHRHIEAVALAWAERYGFDEIATPVFEFTEVFSRSLGATSDIVGKEMYTFDDRGGDRLTLRPENTAGVCRALISNGLAHEVPVKWFYRGPMFRYERPQKGRLRQFHQIGVEVLGVAAPLADVEAIALAADILHDLGLGARVELEINTLGDAASREAYRAVLVDHLERHRDRLSEDSLRRLERNPLRVLDSKDPRDREIVSDAPALDDSLNAPSRAFFEAVEAGLQALAIPYRRNPHLVRGLDYYCHTAFEFTTGALGTQNAVLAGGRYDGLVAELGGPPTAGVGWAAGVERLAMLIDGGPAPARPLAVVPVEEDQYLTALSVARRLRAQGFVVDIGFAGGIGKRMKRANRIGARAALIIGSDEAARATATVRDMDTGDQEEMSLDRLADSLAHFR